MKLTTKFNVASIGSKLNTSVFILLACLLVPSFAASTEPLSDRLEYENQISDVSHVGGSWLKLPFTKKLQELERTEYCSAIGAPRGYWRIKEGKLWLVSLRMCRRNVPLENVYEGTGDPMLAEWISGDISTDHGGMLCGSEGFHLYEKTVILRIERGLVRGGSVRSDSFFFF